MKKSRRLTPVARHIENLGHFHLLCKNHFMRLLIVVLPIFLLLSSCGKKIKDINKIDSIIKETIPQNIKDAYKLLKTKKGGSKEKTPKSITKRKNKWINRKSYKYIK
jgi:hypothetical protein